MPGNPELQPSAGWPRALGRVIPESRARVILIAACLVPLGLGVGLILALPQSSDLWFYKHWARLVTLSGISAAYSGMPTEGYVDYPPFLLYPWKAVGHLYQWFVDPTYDKYDMFESGTYEFLIAMVAVLFHLATGIALYWISRVRYGARTATAAAVLYLLNPAALYNVAYLGLPDTAHSFWLVLAFGLAELNHPRAGWAAAALAALTKPQAWSLMPLFAWRQLCVGGVRRTLAGLAIGGAAATVVIAPFIFNGRLGHLLKLPSHMVELEAVLSAQAHNLWWLVSRGTGLDFPDGTLLIGPLAYRHVALLLLGASVLAVFWRARTAGPEAMLVLAAYQAFAWFCLTTRAHENHWFFALPLAALALPTDRRMFPIFLAVSATGFANLLLHDEYFGPKLVASLSQAVILNAQLANSVVNLLILAVWTIWLVRPTAFARSSAAHPPSRMSHGWRLKSSGRPGPGAEEVQ